MPGLPRRRAHVPAHRPGGGPRGPRRPTGAHRDPDVACRGTPPSRSPARHDYLAFAEREDARRRHDGTPPYSRQIRVVFEDEDEGRTIAETAARFAAAVAEAVGAGAKVLGPGEAPIALLRGRHRHSFMVRGPLTGDGIERAKGAPDRARRVDRAAAGRDRRRTRWRCSEDPALSATRRAAGSAAA
jgi:primosomal protein N'